MHKQAGLSLIELMISITLGLILMTGVVQVFLSSKTTFTTQQAMSRVQETGRLAIEFISRDIRMAAYYGCVRPESVINGDLSKGGLHENFGEGIRGYDEADDLPNGKENDLGGMTLLPDTHTANIVAVRSANQVGMPITKANDSSSLYAYTHETTKVGNCVGDICVSSVLVAADCTKARVFEVSNVDVDSNELTVSHADTWGGGIFPLENFTTGEIMPMNTIVYFLAEGTSGQPVLWQRTNVGDPVELLEGVEHMRITYATSDNTAYRLASELAAGDWGNVNSVRVELVARSLENNVLEEPQPYTFAGVPITPPAGDRFLRQVFSTTIGIRSRAVLN